MTTDITKYPLSGLEMEQLNPDAKILNCTQLYDCHNTKQLFGKYKKIIILYLIQNEHSGHSIGLLAYSKIKAVFISLIC